MQHERSYCPFCGYPRSLDKGHYFGIYVPGGKCGNCGFLDTVAALKKKKLEDEKNARVKALKENPPIFKTVEDGVSQCVSSQSIDERSSSFELQDNDLSRLVLACKYLFEDYTMVDDCLGLRTWWNDNKHRFMER